MNISLQLKKWHGSLTSFSPPEFPSWTANVVANSSDSSSTTSTAGDHSTMAIHKTPQLTHTNSSSDTVMQLDVSIKGGNVGHDPNAIASISSKPDSDDVVDANIQHLSPVTLKESCCQVLVESSIISKPATLFSTCVDYISCPPNEYYKCSMLLPRHMNTPNYRMELLDHRPEQTLPLVIIKQVRLYDDLLVDPRVKKYLLDQATACKYQVVVHKLSDQTISTWSHKQEPSWQDIDPYLSLEDIGSSDVEASQQEEISNTTIWYNLRDRNTRKRLTNWPTCSTGKAISYTAMFDDSDSSPTPKKLRKQLLPSLSGPFKARMMASNTPMVHPKISHLVVKKSLKVETPSIPSPSPESLDVETVLYNSQDTHENNDDEDVPLSVVKNRMSNAASSSNTKPSSTSTNKHVFVSKTAGRIKQKQHCTFKCSKCDKCTNSLAELNTHYRGNHTPVKCKYCNQLFNTSSLLTRHQYFHEIVTKKCQCGKVFRFNSELQAHKLKHCRIPTQHCSHPNCSHSYFSALDLAKHAKTYGNIAWNCNKCDYTTNDKRLLKSHQWKHDSNTRYTCSKCNKSFMYHTQWSCHSKNNVCEIISFYTVSYSKYFLQIVIMLTLFALYLWATVSIPNGLSNH